MFDNSNRPRTLIVAMYFLLIGIWAAPASAQVKRSHVAPNRERVEAVVREAYDKFHSDTNGKNADYIPYLARVDSKLSGCRS